MNANKSSLLLYVAIGVAIVTVTMIGALYFPQMWSHWNYNWIEFALLTVVLFGYLLKWYWSSAKAVRFWAVYGSLLVAHCLVFIPVFAHLGRVPIIWFGVLAALEGSLLVGAVSWLMEKGSGT